MSGGVFGTATRAADGCIVTFELPDGGIRVEHFTQLLRTTQKFLKRTVTIDGAPPVEQAVARADVLNAKIVSISSPLTIVTDLRGKRVQKDSRTGEAPDVVYPERVMLGKLGRLDLFKRPAGGQTGQNIRQVRQGEQG